MTRIIENRARNEQIQMLTAETQMALGEIRGVARIFRSLQSHRPDSLYRGLLCM